MNQLMAVPTLEAECSLELEGKQWTRRSGHVRCGDEISQLYAPDLKMNHRAVQYFACTSICELSVQVQLGKLLKTG